jgi:tetratricopeptide (TPR) repeat protein
MFLFIGATSTWFAIPLRDYAFRTNNFALTPTRFQLPCQILIGSFVVILLICRPLRSSIYGRSATAQLSLLVVLVFPYLVMIWDTECSIRASYLSHQLIYLNQQISTEFNQLQIDWMKSVRLVPLVWDGETAPLLQIPLRPFQVRFIEAVLGSKLYSLNEYPTAPMQLSLGESYLYGLGYNDIFLRLAKKGFFCTAIGALLLILSACLPATQPIKVLGRNFMALMSLSVVAVSLCATPIVIAARDIDHADLLRAQGRYDASLKLLDKASQLLPILEANTSFHLLRGEQLIRTQRVEHPDYYLAMAFHFVRSKRMEEALWEFRKASMADTRDNLLLRLILANALFNEAAKLYNSGNFTGALKEWSSVLQYDPVNVAAIYYLAVAAIAQEDTELAQRYAEQVLTIQRYFQRAFKPVSSQAVMMEAWGFFKEGNLSKALEYITRSKDASRL